MRGKLGAQLHADGKRRCAWCPPDPLYMAYHDTEWGKPLHEDGRLFEMLCLEGAQAGLSWITILRKRDNYRAAFDQFDAEKMARYGSDARTRLLSNPGIVRNRLKAVSYTHLDVYKRQAHRISLFDGKKVMRLNLAQRNLRVS